VVAIDQAGQRSGSSGQSESLRRFADAVVGIGEAFVPDALNLAQEDGGSDRTDPLKLLQQPVFLLDVPTGLVTEFPQVACVPRAKSLCSLAQHPRAALVVPLVAVRG